MAYPLSDLGLTIFLFHGVVETSTYEVRNYTRKHLLASDFRRLLSEWKKCGSPVSMDQVIDLHNNKRNFSPRTFAITFDDGFRNNLTVAAPILSELGIPATFYVTTQFVDKNGMSWIDKIEWALEKTKAGSISLPWRDSPRNFDTIEQRIALLSEIRKEVKSNKNIDIESLVLGVFRDTYLDVIFSSDEEIDQKLTWGEVKRLNSDPLFTVGGHSHTHPILSFLSKKDLEFEIDTSLSLLKENSGIEPKHYSYPEGLSHCFNEGVINALKQRDVICCPTAISGINTNEDLFHLYRVMI